MKPSPTKFAEEYKATVEYGSPSLYEAMKQAGYSENVAKRGKAALTPPMIEALVKEGIKYAQIGEKLEPKTVENFIAGKLFSNALIGETTGNEACKMLGSMVKFGSFKSDSNTNLIVLADLRPELTAPDHILVNTEPTQLKSADVE